MLSPSEKQKTHPCYSPAECVIVQSTVAKPKTKSYAVKKVDRKVILKSPPHGKNRSKSNKTVSYVSKTCFFSPSANIFSNICSRELRFPISYVVLATFSRTFCFGVDPNICLFPKTSHLLLAENWMFKGN